VVAKAHWDGHRTEDVVEHLVIASTHAYLLVFTTKVACIG